MNKRRLAGIARWLERGAKHKVSFNMLNGIAFKEVRLEDIEGSMACGTSCCIAGAACYFYNDVPKMVKAEFIRNFCMSKYLEITWGVVKSEAQVLLGLDFLTATALFEPWHEHEKNNGGRMKREIFNDAKWAARCIRKLIATGTVDWEGTL